MYYWTASAFPVYCVPGAASLVRDLDLLYPLADSGSPGHRGATMGDAGEVDGVKRYSTVRLFAITNMPLFFGEMVLQEILTALDAFANERPDSSFYRYFGLSRRTVLILMDYYAGISSPLSLEEGLSC